MGNTESTSQQRLEARNRRPRREHVFISYARKDETWKKRLGKKLEPFAKWGATVWDDGKLEPGDCWRDKIESQLRRTKTAVLLVTRDFLESGFIRDHELPHLIEARRNGELQLLWLPVSDCRYEGWEFANYAAVGNPGEPLDSMSNGEPALALDRTAELVKESLRGSRVLITGSMREDNEGFDRFQKDCNSLGRALAERRYTLVIGSHRRHTADRNVMDGANEAGMEPAAAVHRIGTQKGFEKQLDSPGSWPRVAETDLFLPLLPDWRESRPEQAGNADIVVAVCGSNGTSDLLYEAAWQRKLAIPVGCHGGTARAMFRPLKRRLVRAGAPEEGISEAEIDRLETVFDLELILKILRCFTASTGVL